MDTNDYKKSWIQSFLIVTVFLLFIWLLFPIRYETNDDSGMMYMIAGYTSGNIEIDPIFSEVVWGGIVGGLYKLLPQLPWYTICSMFVIWLSHVVILKAVLQISKKSFIPFLLLYIGGGIYSAVFLQFTTTALWAGIAACVLGTSLFSKENSGKIEVPLLIFLVVISYSIRKSVGMAILVFLGIGFMINSFEEYTKGRDIKKNVLVFGSTILAVLIVSSITFIYENGDGWKEWRVYNKERAIYKDYGAISYEENPNIYEEIGWDKNLYDLVSGWFFMDSRVNKESFETLNKYKQDSENVSLIKSCIGAAQCVIIALKQFPMARIMLMQMSIITLYLICSSVVQRNKFLFFSVLIIVLCAISMLIYLGMDGRLPLRVFQVCVLPPIILLGHLYVKDRQIVQLEFGKYVNIFVVFILFICMIESVGCTYRQTLDEDVTKGIEINMKMERYAVNHPNNIYIYDTSMAFGTDPFVTYPSRKPTNYIFWGGSAMFSPIYERQLETYRKKELYADAFLEKNVILFQGKKLMKRLC